MKSSKRIMKVNVSVKDNLSLELKSPKDHTATKLQRQNNILVKLEKKEKGKSKI